MKILQIIPSISLVYGGPSQMVLGLSSALARSGVQVTILTTDANGDAGQAPLPVPLGIPVEQDGYEILYFRCAPFRRYKFSIDLLTWLWENADRYDVAHIHALFSPVTSLAATIARMRGLPYILRPLGTLDPADLQKKRTIKQLYAQVLERPNLAGAAALHFTSEQEAKVSERFGTQSLDWVYPLGVQLPAAERSIAETKAALNLPNDRPILLFMSRIDPKKGLDLLIPALEKLSQTTPFHFILAGGNPQDSGYETQIKQKIQQSQLHDRTTLTGFVSGSLKTELLQVADLFVLPSYYENFGIAVAEAMSVGTPVVISNQVHIYHQIEQSESGWICECTSESVYNTLKTALKDHHDLRYRGLHAQDYAKQHYSWDAIASQIGQRYQAIIR
ncbi:hormogonium polysaccharide biosynthesis glycosyltransferase HpsP [Alkalinema sp. FACHB-956]|uniref:hormogonium polysaccharide biosynthesis glycosyltransferase HpsP n=1 Tax=Alkalinema sp. FACHB-956 TaxID=2692768 RepID=UPI0016884064|nr:hormogonium polysaccharide biosynthesis glycosyltransferase HpsP [Alkalinema sp. FACHB-956]MBD2328577.1 glycosyltransferase [Alkalinema sp. FACHB-956]